MVYISVLTPKNFSTLSCSWDRTAPTAVYQKSIVIINGSGVALHGALTNICLKVLKFSIISVILSIIFLVFTLFTLAVIWANPGKNSDNSLPVDG